MSAQSQGPAQARQAIQALLSDAPLNETADYGSWTATVQAVQHAYDAGGKDGAVAAVNALLRSGAGKGLRQLLAGEPPAASVPPGERSSCPPLPPEAAALLDHRTPCAPFLHDYVQFAEEAAPMTPRSFHQAMALWLVSTVVARRVRLRVSTKSIYPNLFLLFIAPSTLYHKTTGLNLGSGLLEAAGLEHLLLPERPTPEALLQDLGCTIPSTSSSWDDTTWPLWLRERAFAAQRGWLLDEASGLFDSFKREYNTGMLTLLLNLYECPTRITEQTVGRGRTTIRDAYCSFFGAATPSALAEHLRNPTHWTNGLWARFALLTPSEAPRWRFFRDALDYPPALVSALQRIDALLPARTARIVEAVVDDTKQRVVEVEDGGPPLTARLAPGVWERWETYCKALGHDLLRSGVVDEALYGVYGRLGDQAMKVALLLAVMDAAEQGREGLPISVELYHLTGGVEYTEDWRASMHRVWEQGVTTEEAKLSDRLLLLLAQAGPGGLLTRDLYRPLHLPAKQAREVLEELARIGQVEPFNVQQGGRVLEKWRLVEQDEPVAEVSQSHKSHLS
jgi:hypothetical protein